MMKRLRIIFLLSLTLSQLFAQDLRKGFVNPPHSAKPVVWWHWTGSNITREGITKDLEWMKRTGIGGFQAFDVSLGSGQTVEKKVKYMTPEWLELFRHTAAEADRLGLDMTVVTAAGWSETGGVWVKPQEAMKKVVWSELQVKGGTSFNAALPLPPTVNGPIRNLPKGGGFGGGTAKDKTLYADQFILAFKTPEAALVSAKPTITNHKGETIAPEALLDDDLTSKIKIETPKPDQPIYLQYEYAQPFTARSFSLALGSAGFFPSTSMRPGMLQVSDDGKNFKTFHIISGAQHDIRALPIRTFSFPEVTGKFFRVVFLSGPGVTVTTVGGPDDTGGFMGPATPPKSFDIAEVIFRSVARVNRWEDKANFAPMFAFDTFQTPETGASSAINPNEMIDLTSKLKIDGTLEWQVPAGNWTILRLGYSLTGAKNGPAIGDATGLEVDKLNKEHLLSYMSQWSNPLATALGNLYGKSLKYFLVDSYEADAQNWSENIVTEFKNRRGYDPIRYLPTLSGYIVDNAEVSDRFLWDYRLTIADLLVDNHYAALTEFAHKQGIKTYGEVGGISMPIIQDALRNKGAVDIPMGEFGMTQGLGSGAEKDWTSPADLENQKAYGGANDRLNAHQADVREVASAGHIYGKKVVAAESWTGGGYEAPADLKFIGDYWSTQGINQFIFHTSAHQPLDTKPGNTMVGTHFHRNITWAEQAKPFVDYITRNQYLLQEGRFVADIAYYLGEDIPAAVPYWEKLRYEIPNGYDYDFVNTEILNRFTVENGDLVLPSGMRYKVLVLPEKMTMTLPVLEKIEALVKEGATIVGPKPEKSPGLVGYPAVDNTIAMKANEIWGVADGKFIYQNRYGKGRVFWNAPLMGIFGQMGIKKDVEYTLPHTNTRINWIHRQTADADYYFLLNMRKQTEDISINFRITGKVPELWRADKGTTEPLAYTIDNGITTVKLHLNPQESVFVVFQQTTTQNQKAVVDKSVDIVNNLSANWTLNFPEKWGAPKQVVLPQLISWTDHVDAGVQSFSGTAKYTKTIEIKKPAPNSSLILDLGTVKDIAVVSLNGIVLDTLWKAPYQIDITKAAKPGKNTLAISITNQWSNRIAADARLPKESKILASGGGGLGGTPKAKESGLIGPVVIIRKR
ncbi:glycosyl hydrolase [Emticicia agri]|uniref:Glycoside hydrolase n=1 Tax=Emticicia agri TaxID=2492393 RepID=A0A4Q5LXS1_9BACT|nr:glycosyl hydrolase [Emticicia agri]RYU94439.1 glycoside hydrolase [Emticicia agri]